MNISRQRKSSAEADFTAFYRETYPSVLAYALRRSPRHVAEEVAATTMTIAWRRFGDVPDPPLPWLLGVARRTLANETRSERRRSRLMARVLTEPTDRLAQSDDREFRDVLEALSELRQRDQEALLLVAWEGLSTAEVAAVVGCSAIALRIRLHRARRRLAEHMQLKQSVGATNRSGLKARFPEEVS
jgi:RNA polymerase sigma-70 factor (ECF subfamily)